MAERGLEHLKKTSVIKDFARSMKGSDADRVGLDFCVWLADGRTVFLDVKSSEIGACHAEDSRNQFGRDRAMNPSIGFIGDSFGPKSIFLRSQLVVVDPAGFDALNIAKLQQAIDAARALPQDLQAVALNPALQRW